jgi:aspartate carbamoyltransferase catalytic subunit
MSEASGDIRHVLSVDDLSAEEIETIFGRASEFKEKGFSGSKLYDREPGNAPVVALAFFEPSTRTKLSFDSAAQRIGAKTIGFDNPATTSSAKGEQLEDTLRVIGTYSDVIVMRRKEHDTPEIVEASATKPVMSAGVGAQEHPTQALLDVFTIGEHRSLETIKHIIQYGDLANSRCMMSEVRMLAKPGVTFSFVADDEMQITKEFEDEVASRGATVNKTNDLDTVIRDADFIHVIRPQRERWGDDAHLIYAPITPEIISKMKDDALVLHALPRTGELVPTTDSDSRSVIWEQVENGMYIRAALLEWILT